MGRALGVLPVALGSNPVPTSGLDLFPVVQDLTLPLVSFCQLGFLILFLLRLNCSFQII